MTGVHFNFINECIIELKMLMCIFYGAVWVWDGPREETLVICNNYIKKVILT